MLRRAALALAGLFSLAALAPVLADDTGLAYSHDLRKEQAKRGKREARARGVLFPETYLEPSPGPWADVSSSLPVPPSSDRLK